MSLGFYATKIFRYTKRMACLEEASAALGDYPSAQRRLHFAMAPPCSAGPCPIYERRDEALREYIAAPQSLEAIGHVMEGVSLLSREMCKHLSPLLSRRWL